MCSKHARIKIIPEDKGVKVVAPQASETVIVKPTPTVDENRIVFTPL